MCIIHPISEFSSNEGPLIPPHHSAVKVPLSRSPTPPSGLVVAPPAAFQTAAAVTTAIDIDAPSPDIVDRRSYSFESDLVSSSNRRRQQPRPFPSSEAAAPTGSVRTVASAANGRGGAASSSGGCCDCHTRRRCRQISCVAVLVGTASLR